MTPLEAVLLVAVLALPLHALVLWQIDRVHDPRYLRAHGIVVVHERALQGHGDAMGLYAGRPIWESVTFMGTVYRFHRIARPRDREKTGPGELYLDPGLVYLAD